jgi:hypothetical protein
VLNLAGKHNDFEAKLLEHAKYVDASKKKLQDEIEKNDEYSIQRAKTDYASHMRNLF